MLFYLVMTSYPIARSYYVCYLMLTNFMVDGSYYVVLTRNDEFSCR